MRAPVVLALLLAPTLAHATGDCVYNGHPARFVDCLYQELQALEADLQGQVVDLQGQVVDLQDQLDAAEADRVALEEAVTALLAGQEVQAAWIDALAVYVSVDPDTNRVVFTGANVLVQSGAGSTSSQNGLGNLIVGYNEPDGGERSGSHNLVIGPYHDYSSWGALVAGENNHVTAPGTAVLGGVDNAATAPGAVVVGGAGNVAAGESSVVTGGINMTLSENATTDLDARITAVEDAVQAVLADLDESADRLEALEDRTTPKVVFVTSQTFRPGVDFSDVAGADALCQAAASEAGWSGTWLAWMSEIGVNPTDRFVHSLYGYRLVNGSRVSRDWQELVDDDIDAPIAFDEHGDWVDDERVWTGTASDGSSQAYTCGEWERNTSSYKAFAGGTTHTGYLWTGGDSQGHTSLLSCDNLAHLYCFEQ